MKSYRFLLVLVVMILVSALIPLSAPDLAGPSKCKIVNRTTEAVFDNLQAAVGAASSGETLKLKGGCVGHTVINKYLSIDGHSNPASGPATLDGNGGNNRVLTISPGSNITLEGLTITGGDDGGGIYNSGTLNIDDA